MRVPVAAELLRFLPSVADLERRAWEAEAKATAWQLQAEELERRLNSSQAELLAESRKVADFMATQITGHRIFQKLDEEVVQVNTEPPRGGRMLARRAIAEATERLKRQVISGTDAAA